MDGVADHVGRRSPLGPIGIWSVSDFPSSTDAGRYNADNAASCTSEFGQFLIKFSPVVGNPIGFVFSHIEIRPLLPPSIAGTSGRRERESSPSDFKLRHYLIST